MDQKEIKEIKFPKMFNDRNIKEKAFEYLKEQADYLLDLKEVSQEEFESLFTDKAVLIFDFVDMLLGE